MHDHDDQQPLAANTELKRKRYLQYTAITITVFAVLYFFYWFLISRFYIETDNAYVNGNIIEVSPQTTGTIKAIYADITDYVKNGQVLFTIDSQNADVQLANARANLAKAIREVQQSFLAVQKNQDHVTLRQAELTNAISIYKRRETLLKTKNVSQEEWHSAKATKEAADAQYQEALKLLALSIITVKNTNVFDHPIVEMAKSEFRNAYLNKKRTIVYSPISGYVAKRSAQVGSLATPGSPLFVIVPLDEIWVDANFKETQLSRLRIGQPVTLEADKNGRLYHGKVAGIYPGTGSVFSLLPAQNASGNWIKITQRLSVRINLDKKEIREYPLEIGLSMLATVDTHNLQLPYLNAQPITGQSRYATSIYQYDLSDADAEIMRIYNEQIKPDNQYSLPTENKIT